VDLDVLPVSRSRYGLIVSEQPMRVRLVKPNQLNTTVISEISRWKLGQAIDAVTGTQRLGAVLPIDES
jgi:hypothetical protein